MPGPRSATSSTTLPSAARVVTSTGGAPYAIALSTRFATSRENAVGRSGTAGTAPAAKRTSLPAAHVAVDAGCDDRVRVARLDGGVLVRPREFEELADDPVHFLDVVDHAGARRVVARLHLDAEAQPRERRAQVVRDPREQQRAVLLQLPQVARSSG